MLENLTEEEALLILKRGSTAHEEIIVIKRLHAMMFGDLSTPALLSRIIFWSGRSRLEGGWFYKTISDMCLETSLSDRTLRNKVKKLDTAGVIETAVKKVGGFPVLHWRLKAKSLLELEFNYLKSLDTANIAETETAGIADSETARIAGTTFIQKDKQHISSRKVTDFEIPEWVDRETWNAFCKMRIAKGVFTTEAKKGIIRELTKFKDAGEDTKAILEKSIMYSWSGVFSLKKKGENYGKGFNGNVRSEKSGHGNGTADKYADLHQEPIEER